MLHEREKIGERSVFLSSCGHRDEAGDRRDAVEVGRDSGVGVGVAEGVVGLPYGGGGDDKEHDVDKMLKHEANYQDYHFRFQLVVLVEQISEMLLLARSGGRGEN